MGYYQIICNPTQKLHFKTNKYPSRSISARNLKAIPSRRKSFKKIFFRYCFDQWKKHKPEVTNTKSTYKFKKSIITEKQNSLYNIHSLYYA